MIKIKSIVYSMIFISILCINTNPIEAITLNQEQQFTTSLYIDELLSIKEDQLQLKSEIDKLEMAENEEVVTVSFIEGAYIYNENTYLDDLRKELQELEISEVQMIKYIEQETSKYLKINKQDFLQSMWPVDTEYSYISSDYGNRIHPISGKYSFHDGIDIPAPKGEDILSCDNGIVIFSGSQSGYGNVVKIKHFDQKVSVYAHNSENLVKEGDIIKKGEVIAKVGSTGVSTGNHIHFEIQLNDETIDPMKVVSID